MTQPPDRYEYPAPYYAGGWQQPAAPQAPWDGVSIAALATGVVGLGPVPIVLGAMGATRTAGRRRRGRWMAWVGLALGVVSTLSWVALVGLAVLLLRPLPADVSAPRFATPQQLVVGNCLQTLPTDGEVWAVRVVPCADSDESAAQLCAAAPTDGGRLVVWAPTPGHATVTCLVTTPAGAPSST